MMTLSQLQQEINEAEAKVNELRKKLDEKRKAERTQAISAARDLIKIHGLTGLELGFTGKTSTKRASSDDKRITVAPKYKDPSSSKTWTGRGKTPRWLVTYLSSGKSKQDYLIK